MTTLSASPTHHTGLANKEGSNWLVLAAVVLLHALGFAWAARQLEITEPVPLPRSVVGALVAPQPKNTAPPQKITVPQPQKKEPLPVRKPLPEPRKATEPATKPTSAPEPQQHTAPVPAQPSVQAPPAPPVAAAASPAPVQEAQESVTPPRTDATRLKNADPIYPPLSRRLGEQGQVLLDVHIMTDGSVGEIRLNRSSGFPRLDNAALQAVKTWRYVPARRGDKPIPFWYVQPISFVLNN